MWDIPSGDSRARQSLCCLEHHGADEGLEQESSQTFSHIQKISLWPKLPEIIYTTFVIWNLCQYAFSGRAYNKLAGFTFTGHFIEGVTWSNLSE